MTEWREKDEGPLEQDLADLGEDAESDTLPCPRCGAPVYEAAEKCPACGEWIIARLDASAGAGRLWWWVALAVAGAIAFVLFYALTP